jgi:hypothetical protein
VSWKKRTAWALVILGVVLLLVWGARLARIGLSLREHLAQAQALIEQSRWTRWKPAISCTIYATTWWPCAERRAA